MTRAADTQAVRQILEAALHTSLEGIENPTRAEIEGWDSLAHLEIVFMVEDEFDIRLSEEQMVELRSLESIVAFLGGRHAP